MSVMSRIRNNMALVAVIIAIAILAFVVQDGLSKLIGGSSGPSDVGTIAGQPITAEEFRLKYNTALENQRQQNGGSLSEAQRNNILNQTWNGFVNEVIYDKELGDVGLKVTGAELADMFGGNNISPYVKNYFQGYFESQQKEFNKESILEYIELLETQGTADQRNGFIEFEKNIKEFRAQERYRNMVKAGFVGSDSLAAAKFREINRKADIAFLAVNYTTIPDSVVDVTDADYRNYISENQHRFKQQEETNIRYVQFPIVPSAKDSARTYAELSKLKENFKNTITDSVFTSNKSRNPFTGAHVEVYSLPAAVQNDVVNAEPKTVMGPYLDTDYYKMFKLVSVENSDEKFSKIRHIVIRPNGNTVEDSATARSEANDIKRQIQRGDNFATVAAEKSTDFATKDKGGNLNWYRKGVYGEDFDNAIANASVGSVIGPLKTNQGYHIVKIDGRTQKKFALAEIEKNIFASTATVNEVDKKANNFTATVMQTKNIETAAAQANIQSLSSGPLVAASSTLPNVQEGARRIIRWALNSDVNDLSEIFRAGNAFVVAQVTSKKAEGTKSLDDVRASIRPQVFNKKKAEMIKSKLSGLDNSNLTAMKDGYGGGALIDNASGISFSSNSIPKIGNDPYLIGKVMGMGVNEVSQPLEGTNGVFVIQVTKVNAGAPSDELSIKSTRGSEVVGGQSTLQTRADEALRELADVKDTRYKAEF